MPASKGKGEGKGDGKGRGQRCGEGDAVRKGGEGKGRKGKERRERKGRGVPPHLSLHFKHCLRLMFRSSLFTFCTQLPDPSFNKKLSCRKETGRLLRGSVLANCNWETIFCGHYRSIFNRCDVIGLQSYRVQ